jgi:hypothetical protein
MENSNSATDTAHHDKQTEDLAMKTFTHLLAFATGLLLSDTFTLLARVFTTIAAKAP